MNEELKEGDRVRVSIQEPERYAHGAAEALNGLTGTVGKVRNAREMLIDFDIPAPKWWSGQSEVTGFWFGPKELVKLS